MLNQPESTRRQTVGRAAIWLTVCAAHVAFLVLLAYSPTRIVKKQEVVPITATLLSQNPTPQESVKLPKLTNVINPVDVDIPPPDIDIPSEGISVPSAAASVDQPSGPSSPPAAPQSAPGPQLPSMSTVAYLRPPAPSYPRQSRLSHEEGLVVLRVLINELGRAQDIDVYRSSGHPRLDQEACSAVARALFKPYLQGGVAHLAIAMVPIEFSLHRSF